MKLKLFVLALFGFACIADYLHGEFSPSIHRLEESSTYALAAGPVIGLVYGWFRRRWRKSLT